MVRHGRHLDAAIKAARFAAEPDGQIALNVTDVRCSVEGVSAMPTTAKNPACAHHCSAASEHEAAAHHHREAAHHLEQNEHDEAKVHSNSAHAHSQEADRHTKTAHQHTQK